MAKSRKTLLVAWPSADWKIILPLIDEGKLPNLQQLTEQGVIGKLAGFSHSGASVAWTTLVTGKFPHQHHMLADYEALPQAKGVRPVSSLGRGSKALWNILNQNGYQCHVVGWPATHPVEPIQGAMLSQHFAKASAPNPLDWPLPPNTIHPENLQEPLAPLRVHPTEIFREDLLPFVPQFDTLHQAQDQRLITLALILAETASIQSAATELMQTKPWDFMAVYFDGIAQISQQFMRYYPPRPDFVSEQDFDYFKGVIETTYIFYDAMLGALIDLAGKDATILVVSEKGYHSGAERTDKPSGSRPAPKELGMFALCGVGIKRDNLLFQSSLLDIAPTLLHLYGLPVGQDMAGKVLSTALTSPDEVQWVDSWENIDGETGQHPSDKRYNPLDILAAIELKSKDIDPTLDDRASFIQELVFDLNFQLSQSLTAARQRTDTIELLEKIWKAHPFNSKCGNKLMSCYVVINRLDLARQTFERMLADKKRQAPIALKQWKALSAKAPETLTPQERQQLSVLWKQSRVNLSGMAYLQAWLLQAEGKFEEALVAANRADENKVYNRVGLYKLKASCLMALQKLDEAAAEYEKMLAFQPNNADAHLGLAQIKFEQEDFKASVDHAAACIGLRYLSPSAHFIYGTAVYRLGDPRKAADALKIAAQQGPSKAAASYQRLALLYSGPLKDTKQCAYYTEKAKQALAEQEARKQAGIIDVELEEEVEDFF